MTLTPKPKTFFVILEILKILIQNQVKAGEYYIGTCRGKDARHRVSTNPGNPKNPLKSVIQKMGIPPFLPPAFARPQIDK